MSNEIKISGFSVSYNKLVEAESYRKLRNQAYKHLGEWSDVQWIDHILMLVIENSDDVKKLLIP